MQSSRALRGVMGVALCATFLSLSHVSAAPYGITRVSVNSAGVPGNGESGYPVLSPDGRFVAFYSWATNLAPARAVPGIDCFLRDRSLGTTERVSVDIPGLGPNYRASPGAISAGGRYVAFAAVPTDPATGFPSGHGQVYVRDRHRKVTELVSVSTSGTPGDSYYGVVEISADGRFVAFGSLSTNLVPGDTNGKWDIFVRDRKLQTTERVSVASDGTEGNGECFVPSISADGRYVTFESTSTALVPDDTNGTRDIFVRDRELGTTRRVSFTTSGQQRTDISSPGSISGNGRYVVYAAGNYPDGPPPVPARFPTNYAFDVYVYDLVHQTTERVSVSSTEEGGNGPSQALGGDMPPHISADGRFVAFYSLASNLDVNDLNEVPDLFVRDRLWGTTERISLDPAGSQTFHPSMYPHLSADGTLVAFESVANNLVPGDLALTNDVFVVQRGPGSENLPAVAYAGADQLLSPAHDGAPATNTTTAVLNAEGSYDPDGETLFYEWRNTAGEPVSTDAQFSPVVGVGVHRFTLSVMDIFGTRAQDAVTVTVLPEANRAPVANAGPGQWLTVPNDGNPSTNTVSATLNGGLSVDPDGDPLTYTWKDASETVVAGTAGFTTSLAPGKHSFRLTVTDSYGATDEEAVSVLVGRERNRRPVARAGADQAVAEVAEAPTPVTLNGAASSDPDGDTLTYAWSVLGNPLATGASPTVDLEPGQHRVKLTVTDPYGATATDEVLVTVGVVDVTGDVLIRKGRLTAAGRRGNYTVVVRVTNRTAEPLPAPVSVVLDGLPAAVKVTNATGTTTEASGVAGRPYLNAKGSLAPGRTVALTFRLTVRGRATTLPGSQRVLAGIGPR